MPSWILGPRGSPLRLGARGSPGGAVSPTPFDTRWPFDGELASFFRMTSVSVAPRKVAIRALSREGAHLRGTRGVQIRGGPRRPAHQPVPAARSESGKRPPRVPQCRLPRRVKVASSLVDSVESPQDRRTRSGPCHRLLKRCDLGVPTVELPISISVMPLGKNSPHRCDRGPAINFSCGESAWRSSPFNGRSIVPDWSRTDQGSRPPTAGLVRRFDPRVGTSSPGSNAASISRQDKVPNRGGNGVIHDTSPGAPRVGAS